MELCQGLAVSLAEHKQKRGVYLLWVRPSVGQYGFFQVGATMLKYARRSSRLKSI